MLLDMAQVIEHELRKGHHLVPPLTFPAKLLASFNVDFQADADDVAVVEVFCFPDAVFERDDVAAVLVEQGCLPGGLADADIRRDHAPAVGHGT